LLTTSPIGLIALLPLGKMVEQILSGMFHGSKIQLLSNTRKVYFSGCLRSKCELLILAGCSTGVGFKSDEGIIDLARGFTNAGVKSMILTSEDVDEASTLKVLEKWFLYLSKGYSKSKALQLAQQDYLNNTTSRKSNPSYWASLTLIDHSEPVRIKTKKQQHYYIACLMLGILGVFALFAFKKLRI
jgi:hypothetical protein